MSKLYVSNSTFSQTWSQIYFAVTNWSCSSNSDHVLTMFLRYAFENWPSSISSTLSHYGPAKKVRPVKAGSQNLYYHHINDFNA